MGGRGGGTSLIGIVPTGISSKYFGETLGAHCQGQQWLVVVNIHRRRTRKEGRKKGRK